MPSELGIHEIAYAAYAWVRRNARQDPGSAQCTRRCPSPLARGDWVSILNGRNGIRLEPFGRNLGNLMGALEVQEVTCIERL